MGLRVCAFLFSYLRRVLIALSIWFIHHMVAEGLLTVIADENEANALDEYILQQEEEAMQMQMQAQHQEQMQMQMQMQMQNQQHTPNNRTSSFSDDEYDDIFTDLADHSQDMDMSG